jgi:hypothetical protein
MSDTPAVREKVMSFNKLSTIAIIASTVALTILTMTATGLLSVNKTISSTGAVTAINVGVYSDSACTSELTSIDWGTISPGNSENRTIYLKNTGNAQITLSMTSTNWNPASAGGPITLTWNRDNAILNIDQVAMATLTLSLSDSINGINNFSFDIVITGTE